MSKKDLFWYLLATVVWGTVLAFSGAEGWLLYGPG